ncbi:alpha/beta hydrolase domain-containing protein [Gordonia sp. NPDC003376]
MRAVVTFSVLHGGKGHNILAAAKTPDLRDSDYSETEYAASGTARHFLADAHGGVVEAGAAPYITRILVRRPERAAAFNGFVVVEWFNVSSGVDAAPEYSYLADELIRSGYAWVGVSAQYTGIEGGAGSVGLGEALGGPQGLAAKEPERYGTLHHPGDAFCWDIFGQIGAALADNDAPGHPLAGLAVRHLIAVGESQSAMALTTYTNHFVDHHQVFDGVLIHSRSMGTLPLGPVGGPADITDAYHGEPVSISLDITVPVFVVQTETDVLTNFQYVRARQPDSDRLRVWEIAGTAHADLHQIGEYESMLGCPSPVNRGQQRFVLRAALRHLRDWVVGTAEPPVAPPLLVTDAHGHPQFEVDAVGNVLDGVRTPCVDVPTQVLSGVVDADVPRICVLFGKTSPLPPSILADLYADEQEYLASYATAADAAITAGFILPEDRDALLADARTDLIAGASAFR